MRRGAVAVVLLALASLAGGQGAGAGQGAQRPVVAVPASIDGTGGTDVTDALNGVIASAPDGSVVSFPAGARYRIDGSLRVVDRRDLVFEGNGATFFAVTRGARNRQQWEVIRGSNLVFRNMVVVGANPNAGIEREAYVPELEAQHGFTLRGAEGVEIDRVSVSDVYGDFVYVGPHDGRVWSKDVWIHDSVFRRTGRQGISVTAGERVLIERNDIEGTRHATFDFEPNGADWGVRDVTIRQNVIGPGRLLMVASNGAGPVDRVAIVDNVVHGRAMASSFQADGAERRTGLVFSGNRSDTAHGSSDGAVLRVTGYDGVEVVGNEQPMQEGRNMVLLRAIASCQVVVRGNMLANAQGEYREESRTDCTGAPTAPMPVLPRMLQAPPEPVPPPPAPPAEVPATGATTPPPAPPPSTAPPIPSTPPTAPPTSGPPPASPVPPASDQLADGAPVDVGDDDERPPVAPVVVAALLLAATWAAHAAVARREGAQGRAPPPK